jgi:phage/conjugal plasmid C-4 type zinc finger TraR family protein
MSGYGGPDDAAEAQLNHVEDSLKVAKMLAEQSIPDNTTGLCYECGEPIPVARQQALPGCHHCIQCAKGLELQARLYARYQLRNTYVS